MDKTRHLFVPLLPNFNPALFKDALTEHWAHCLVRPQLQNHLQGYGNPHCLFQEHGKHHSECSADSFPRPWQALQHHCSLLRCGPRATLVCGADEWCDHSEVTQEKLYWWALKLIHARIPWYRITQSVTGEYLMWTSVSNCWVRPEVGWRGRV